VAGATGPRGPPGPRSGGVVYTRWGNSSCPDAPGTMLVYEGRAGVSHFTHAGGANQCMPLDPEYTLPFRHGVDGYIYMYGAEYMNFRCWAHTNTMSHALCAWHQHVRQS